MLILSVLATQAFAVDLTVAGGCPGKTQIAITAATPSSSVRVLSGTGPGADAIVIDGCSVTTGLAGATARALTTANAGGAKTLWPNVGAGACGMSVQVLDVATCTLSGVDQIALQGHAEGPDFTGDGWVQCNGYYDTAAGSEIPTAWAPDCQGGADNQIRMACGKDVASYRFIDVNKNPFRDGLVAYPEVGIIYNSNFALDANHIYATGNDPDIAVSWWQNGNGCSESSASVTMNNGCTWEASNCFGQNLTADRYLWLYTKP